MNGIHHITQVNHHQYYQDNGTIRPFEQVTDILNKHHIQLENNLPQQTPAGDVINRFCEKNAVQIDPVRLDKHLTELQPGLENNTISLKSLLMVVSVSAPGTDMVDEILGGMYGSVDETKRIRDDIKAMLHELAIELKLFSIIQSQINKALSSSNQTIEIGSNGQNLLDPSLYGMTDAEFNGPPPSKEKAYLDKIFGSDSKTGDFLSIKDFLQSDKKSAEAMTGLSDSYSYDKNNNKLGHFASMVGDISRPLNDMVNEQSTKLNEASNTYNSSIEALTRFIQKLDTLLQDLSGSI